VSVYLTNVNQYDFRHTFYAGAQIFKQSSAVNDIDVEIFFDMPESIGVACLDKAVRTRIKHFAARAETILNGPFKAKKRAQENSPSCIVEINLAGKDAFQNSADTADFADGFVCYMNNIGLIIHYTVSFCEYLAIVISAITLLSYENFIVKLVSTIFLLIFPFSSFLFPVLLSFPLLSSALLSFSLRTLELSKEVFA
jgi:hypothetical protein